LLHREAIDVLFIIIFQELVNIKFSQIVIYRLSNKTSHKLLTKWRTCFTSSWEWYCERSPAQKLQSCGYNPLI